MKITYFTACMAAVLALAGCGNKSGEEVATINGETIFVEDLHKQLENKTRWTVLDANQNMVEAQVAWTPAFQGLLDLITRKVVTQMAKDEKVYPSESDLMKELEFRKKLDPNYVTARTSIGIPYQQVKENLAFELCQERIVTKGVTVTEAQVTQFIKDNPQQFTNPEEVELYYIQVNTPEKKKKVDTELSIGKPFKSVAVMHSDSPTVREDNGRFNARSKTYTEGLPPQLKPQIAKTAVHKSTGWIQSGTSSLMFYVDKRIPAKKMTVDSLLKDQVRRRMAMTEGAKAVDIQKRILERIKTGDFKVRGPLEKMWERYVTELKRSSGPKVDSVDGEQ